MNAEHLSDLPDWEDELDLEDDDLEEWKPNPTRTACKVLYKQWQEVMFLLSGVLMHVLEQGELDDDVEFEYDTARTLLCDAYSVATKIRSSEAGNIYILRMENAAMIRRLAQGISSALLLFTEGDVTDISHVKVVRDEIDKFRQFFIAWVNTFERDEYTDQWGLFV
jgi:hypothetical protein